MQQMRVVLVLAYGCYFSVSQFSLKTVWARRAKFRMHLPAAPAKVTGPRKEKREHNGREC